MAAGPVGVKHPAKTFFALTALLSLIAWVLSLIAIFVPWSWKDISTGHRLWVGLWRSCNESTFTWLFTYTCYDNDVDQIGSITGGDKKCRGYVVAAQVLTVITVVLTFITLILAALIMGKLWSKPIGLALYIAMCSVLAFGACLTAFLMWIVYAEQVCQAPLPTPVQLPDPLKEIIWPLKGYSWGWILMVVATFFAFLAMLTAYLGLYAILRFKPFIPHEEPPMYPVMMEAPVYPMEMAPVPSPYLEPIAYPTFAPQVAYPAPVFGGVY